jgi:hypothetical protein
MLRESEIGEIGVIGVVLGRDQDVRGLYVPVHQRLRMGDVERRGDLSDDAGGERRLEPPPARDQGLEVGALDVLHSDVETTALLAGPKDRDQVRVRYGRGHSGLPLEALPKVPLLGELGRDQLEGDRSLERYVGGHVDDAHTAASGDSLDPIAGQLGADGEVQHEAVISASATPRIASSAPR